MLPTLAQSHGAHSETRPNVHTMKNAKRRALPLFRNWLGENRPKTGTVTVMPVSHLPSVGTKGPNQQQRAARTKPTTMTRSRVRRLEEAMDNFSSQLQCAICLCAYDRATSLPCNHCFCEACIHRALELKTVCPICKAPAKKRNLRPDPMIQRLLDAVDIFNGVGSSCSSQQAVDGHSKPGASAVAVDEAGAGATAADAPDSIGAANTSAIDSTPSSSRPQAAAEVKTKPKETKQSPVPREMTTTPAPSRRRTPLASPSSCREELKRVDAASLDHVQMDVGSPKGVLNAVNGFTPGQIVQVASRTWAGINKPGGVAWIKDVNPDGTVNVKYVLESRRENSILPQFVTAANEMMADTTPSRAAKEKSRASAASGALASGLTALDHLQVVLLLSGFSSKETTQIEAWAEFLEAEIVNEWTSRVTHVIVKCVDREPDQVPDSKQQDGEYGGGDGSNPQQLQRQLFSARTRKWVKNRTLKYLKALVGGRWIVSQDWLKACVESGSYVSEAEFEAFGHAKSQHAADVVRSSRQKREENVTRALENRQDSFVGSVGTQLFQGCWVHIAGEFVSPSPPSHELEILVRIGSGRVFRSWQELALALTQSSSKNPTVVIICLKVTTEIRKNWLLRPPLQSVDRKAVVSFEWILDSISEGQLREFSP